MPDPTPRRDDPSVLHPRNRLLAALPPDELARLAPQLERVELELKQILFDVGQPIEYVYFVETGVASVLGVMSDRSAVEAATVGHEGMVGLPVFHGTDRTSAQGLCQVRGVALRLASDAFRAEVRRQGMLNRMVHLYSQALFTLIAQSSACNRLHTISERCARWLLHTHDRVGAMEGVHEFPLTPQFLSQMLGVRRATASEVMSTLQDRGAVTYAMGVVTVTSRAELERAACECYFIIQREFDRLLDGPESKRRTLPDPLAGVQMSEGGKSTVGDGSPPVAPDDRRRDQEA